MQRDPPAALEVTLRIEQLEPLTGHIGPPAGELEPFAGWIGLGAAIARLAAGDRTQEASELHEGNEA